MAKVSQDDVRMQAQRMEMQLQAIRRALRQGLDAEVAKGNLTAPQTLVMTEIVRANGISLKDLSGKVSLAHSTVSGIVDRLEKKGMIERRPSDVDRRVTLITGSAAVLKFMQTNMPQLMLHPLVSALEKATVAERKTVGAGLDLLERLLGKSSD